jgi:hypothetical protein
MSACATCRDRDGQPVVHPPPPSGPPPAPGRCALCGEGHPRCVFATGSLCCIKPDCKNPHHRPGPLGGAA